MRALIFDGETVRLDANAPPPVAQPGQAVVRLLKAVISPTELAIAQGLLPHHGVVGQQFVGVVERINESGPMNLGPIASSLVGKRVVSSVITSCGKCKRCSTGLSIHCTARTILGVNGVGGCLAEQFAVATSSLCRVPDHIDDDHAVFAAELANAIQAAGQITIESKPFITVLGDGVLAMLCAHLMSRLNASVRVIGFDAGRLELCEKWGIKHRLSDEIGLREDQDVVVDCTNSWAGLQLAMQMVRPRGKILLKSLLLSGSGLRPRGEVDLRPIVLKEIELIGSLCGSLVPALSALSRSEIDVVSLISRRMCLADSTAAIRGATSPGVLGVLVEV